MKALSVKQPWAWAIIHGGKDVENRTWSTNYRGPLLIHAGKTWDQPGARYLFRHNAAPPSKCQFNMGGIIGQVRLVDVVENSKSQWAELDSYHWVLRDPEPLAFMPCRGQLGLFNVDHDETTVAELPLFR